MFLQCTNSNNVPNCSRAVNGEYCKFPFNYNGNTYHQCTRVDSSEPWCATAVDSYGNVIRNADCNAGCDEPLKLPAPIVHPKPPVQTLVQPPVQPLSCPKCPPCQGCSCDSKTVEAHVGKYIGACLTKHNDKFWCYVDKRTNPGCCEDKSSRLVNYCVSYSACSTHIKGGKTPLWETDSFQDCRAVSGESCKFPFNYNGNTYHQCTKVDSAQPWCATALNTNGDAISYADCNAGCPGNPFLP